MLVVDIPFDDRRHRHHDRHYEIFLTPNRRATLAITANVGHTINMALVYLDQNGNPMLVTPVPDTPPTWTQTTPATGTLVAGTDTASELLIAPGTDTVSVSVTVGGTSFSGSVDITATAVPQILTSISITATDVDAPASAAAAKK